MSISAKNQGSCPFKRISTIDAQEASRKLAYFINTTQIVRTYGCEDSIETLLVFDDIKGPGYNELCDMIRKNRFPRMLPVIVILASPGCSGKDSFAEMVSNNLGHIGTSIGVSTVDIPKVLARDMQQALHGKYRTIHDIIGKQAITLLGNLQTDDEDKTDSYRQFIHDLKDAWTKYCNGPMLWLMAHIMTAIKNTAWAPDGDTSKVVPAIFINNRDVDTYDTLVRWCNEIGLLHLTIKLFGRTTEADFTNDCDSNTDKINADIFIRNDGTKVDLANIAVAFAKLMSYGNYLYGVRVTSDMVASVFSD